MASAVGPESTIANEFEVAFNKWFDRGRSESIDKHARANNDREFVSRFYRTLEAFEIAKDTTLQRKLEERGSDRDQVKSKLQGLLRAVQSNLGNFLTVLQRREHV